MSKPATTFIYALKDPLSGAYRYIGKSRDPRQRYDEHLYSARYNHSRPKELWLSGLLIKGLRPTLEVLDEVPHAEFMFWERQYVKLFRMLGHRLVNGNDGGGGVITHTPEARAKIGEASRCKVYTPEMRRRMGQAHLGAKRSAETRAKIGEANRRRVWSEASRRKVAESVRALKSPRDPVRGTFLKCSQ